ncbi:MAG: N-acetylneuraminate synthase family protein [Candidatus Peribacteraceae bacterium]|jgi:N-acetylneuraminate synthase
MATPFDGLFIFEMANNHQGDPEHGKRIIDAMADITKRHGIRGAIKFQFRHLDTFIHKDFRTRKDAKHIGRFLATRLTEKQFSSLAAHARKRKLLVIATPFDEASVQQCLALDVDVIKVASCSALDWPLLERIAAAKKPVIVSTAGVQFADMDKIVSFFEHHSLPFALMHCVGMYPAPDRLLNLAVIPRLLRRYPGVPIGYSGHEAPDDVLPAVTAVGAGAGFLERHVGIGTLNAYSMDPTQTERWVEAACRARTARGVSDKPVHRDEQSSLRSLMRGTYAKRPIRKGQVIRREDVSFAMPLQEGQLSSGSFGSYRSTYAASRNYAAGKPIMEEKHADQALFARELVHEARGMLSEAGIPIGSDGAIELSHHLGLERIREVGAVIITNVNREYCKKLIVMVPGQRHPRHSHERKEETFALLWGDLTVELDGETLRLRPGDYVLVKRNSVHSFSTENGAIFEEISTTHYQGDSFYEDPGIRSLDPMQRKTLIMGDE